MTADENAPRDPRSDAPDLWLDLMRPDLEIERRIRDRFPSTPADLAWEVDPDGKGWAWCGARIICQLRHRPSLALAEIAPRYVVGSWGKLRVFESLPRVWSSLGAKGRVTRIEWRKPGVSGGVISFAFERGAVKENRTTDGRRIVARVFPEDLGPELAAAEAAVAEAEAALAAASKRRQDVLESAVARSRPCRVTLPKGESLPASFGRRSP